jgi:hypothetical protein
LKQEWDIEDTRSLHCFEAREGCEMEIERDPVEIDREFDHHPRSNEVAAQLVILQLGEARLHGIYVCSRAAILPVAPLQKPHQSPESSQ